MVSRVMDMPKAVRGILQPPEKLTVSEWADRYRYLNRRFSAQPGQWRTAHTPYMREPMDAFTDPNVRLMIFVKCSRVGGTEWQNNLLAYTAKARPVPVLYVQPERTAVEEEFHGRLRNMFEDSPALRTTIPTSGDWCTRTHIRLNTIDVFGAWAENPKTLIRRTIGLCLFDEIDNCERAAGGMGNTLELLGERIVTFGHRGKIVADSTPTTESGSGWQLLLQSDYRKPYVPCPLCGWYQVLAFERIKLPPEFGEVRDANRIELEQLARYECEACSGLIEHRQWHRWMIDRTCWIPTAQKPEEMLPLESAEIVKKAMACGPVGHVQWRPSLTGEVPKTNIRGYWLPVMYSPWASRTWSHSLARFFRVKSDPEKLRVFVNSWLAQPWKEVLEVTTVDALKERRDGAVLDDRVVPAEAKVLLCSADVQLDHVYWVVRGWGVGETSWIIAHGTCENFDQLYELAFFGGFPVLNVAGARMRCHSLAIDSGYRTDEVYMFGKRPGVVVVKGVERADYRVKPSKIEYQPQGGTEQESILLYVVNTSLFKSKIHRLARLPLDYPGAWHLNRGTTDDYIQQFCSEHQTWATAKRGKRRGRRELVWETKTESAPNHYLDCEVYGAALADILRLWTLQADTPVTGLMTPAGGTAKAHGETGRASKPSRGFGTGYLR